MQIQSIAIQIVFFSLLCIYFVFQSPRNRFSGNVMPKSAWLCRCDSGWWLVCVLVLVVAFVVCQLQNYCCVECSGGTAFSVTPIGCVLHQSPVYMYVCICTLVHTYLCINRGVPLSMPVCVCVYYVCERCKMSYFTLNKHWVYGWNCDTWIVVLTDWQSTEWNKTK